MMLAKLLLVG